MYRVFNLKEILIFKNWEIIDKNLNFLVFFRGFKDFDNFGFCGNNFSISCFFKGLLWFLLFLKFF